MDQNSAAGIQFKNYSTTSFKRAVDLSTWDMSVYCGSCHVGGGFHEKSRQENAPNNRYSYMMKNYLTANKFDDFNPVDPQHPFDSHLFYISEQFTPDQGILQAQVKMAPWIFPAYNRDAQGNITGPVVVPSGWGRVASMSGMGVMQDNQLMIPNVQEMDCLMCHLQGYNNIMKSVMTYSGAHAMGAMAGAGIMDTNPMSPTYQGYNGATVDINPANGEVSLKADVISRITANPPSNNCRMCHSPSGLKDMPDMMRDFLSSAPMYYTGNFNKSFTGLEMPAYDFNAPFGMKWDFTAGPFAVTPVVDMTNIYSYMIMSIGFPAAMGQTAFNISNPAFTGNPYAIGGGNPAGTGPLYYQAPLNSAQPTGYQDQNVLKKSIVPFPRADWFKRGDVFATDSDEFHMPLVGGCAGCHMDTNTTRVDGPGKDGKSLCDPGRGFDSANGVESNNVAGVDSRNTVKKCYDCHNTGVNSDGVGIDNKGANNPLLAHQQAGLTARIVQAVGLRYSSAQSSPRKVVETSFLGSHLDAIDCATCHVQKKSMAVRVLDSTSGNRYPAIVGTDKSKGMLGMFAEPMPGYKNEYQVWDPLYIWEKNGDAQKVLSTDGQGNETLNSNWRRKVYPINLIVAALFNNVDPTVDGNGDGVKGRAPVPDPANPGRFITYYDPWIQRDLKNGMNFGPSGFDPIPAGFSNGQYMSAYDGDGKFTAPFGVGWDYVGIYGGNVVFTRADQIDNYRNFRTATATDGRSWNGTELLYLGGPYMLTHNVKKTSDFALGKPTRNASGTITGFGCADCHASTKNFFNNGFNVSGSAIPAWTSYAGPSNGLGDPNGPNSMMFRPVVDIPYIEGKAGQFRTGAELARKDGVAVEVEFQKEVDASGNPWVNGVSTGQKYIRSTELSRAEALYPLDSGYKDNKGVVKGDRTAWMAYLNSFNTPTAISDTGVGVDPVAAILNPPDADTANGGNQIIINTTYTLNANTAANKGFVTYEWLFSNNAPKQTGPTATLNVAGTGYVTVTLKVTDEENKIAQSAFAFQAITAPQPAGVTVTPSNTGKTFTFAITGMPAHTSYKFYWGDGQIYTSNTSTASSTVPAHSYTVTGKRRWTLQVYNGATLVQTKYDYITIP
jgi:hypothetical protein